MNSYHRCSSTVIVLMLLMNLGDGRNECRDFLCGPTFDGSFIPIRYPFQLVDGVTGHCGYPLSCTDNMTMLELPAVPDPIRLLVTYIDYESQYLITSDPCYCLPSLYLKLHNSSIYPFEFDSFGESETPNSITFFNCSSAGAGSFEIECPILGADSNESVSELDLESCTKMFDLVPSVLATDLLENSLRLRWSKPNCDPEMVYCKHKLTKISRIVVAAAGSTVLVGLLIAFFLIYRYIRMKGDDQARVEQFLEDYRALKPTRFSYADLKRITNHFKHKLGEGAHGVVFKGQLSSEILVAVKMLNNSEGDGKEFINEVGTMSQIHHINVVRLLGFCADGFYRAFIYDFFPNGSLQKFIASPDNKEIFLGWDKLQQIALGIAKGIEYLHQGCDHQILHFDINPHNVLLDPNFIPKLSDFGLAKLCSKNQSRVSMTTIKGTLGYIAPEVFSRNFGNVSYKSDIYSYGMLLLEMVSGRKNTSKTPESFQVIYPEWIQNLIEGGDTHIQIEDEAEFRIARKLVIVGLWCIQWLSVNRPSMTAVIQMLEGEGDKLKIPPTPFDTTTSTNTNAVIPSRLSNLELETIHELD